jgi:hypothetical protein
MKIAECKSCGSQRLGQNHKWTDSLGCGACGHMNPSKEWFNEKGYLLVSQLPNK